MVQRERDSLFKRHQYLCNQALELMKLKNADYGGDTDPFKNFHDFGSYGILVRLSDKFARLKNLYVKEPKVKSESQEDTILDIINYCVLYLAYKGIERRKNESEVPQDSYSGGVEEPQGKEALYPPDSRGVSNCFWCKSPMEARGTLCNRCTKILA